MDRVGALRACLIEASRAPRTMEKSAKTVAQLNGADT
jgi:hypothetical protein